jgi:hypothetical protein
MQGFIIGIQKMYFDYILNVFNVGTSAVDYLAFYMKLTLFISPALMMENKVALNHFTLCIL